MTDGPAVSDAGGRPTFLLDGEPVAFAPGESILSAALAAGRFVPHLCWDPDLRGHGSCRLCMVQIGGHVVASCTTPARDGDEVLSEIPELLELRQGIVQLLFVEGNHFCPGCEKSGACLLQAMATELGVATERWAPLFPRRELDASHPDVLLDRDRCILCELCVRASAEIDGKSVFALAGRGLGKHVAVSSSSGLLVDTALAVEDAAVAICPVGALLPKRQGYRVPIGARAFDVASVRLVETARARRAKEPR